MRLTSFSDYTLRTLIYLALRPDTLCTIDQIAEAYGISVNHLAKVVHQLALAGEIQTVRGQRGGLQLARSPTDINLGNVLRRSEPDLDIVPCFASSAACRIEPSCVLQGALRKALDAFLAVMDGMTLADLIRPKQQLSSLLGLERKNVTKKGR
jgi:Rrf2 family transcriptional regulator, nitric oxide-sensitive transcriptional repressor